MEKGPYATSPAAYPTKPLILMNAAGFICAHNHPSGDQTPSSEDQQLTTRLKQAADIIGIRMLDHVIIGESGHYSFADNGCLS